MVHTYSAVRGAVCSKCLTEKEVPQAIVVYLVSSHTLVPGHRGRQPLCRAKSWSESGRTVSQVEEDPFSLASFTDLCRLSGSCTVRSRATFELFSLFFALDSNCMAITSCP